MYINITIFISIFYIYVYKCNYIYKYMHIYVYKYNYMYKYIHMYVYK